MTDTISRTKPPDGLLADAAIKSDRVDAEKVMGEPAELYVLGEASLPMTPGTYLRKRREASGVSVGTLGQSMVPAGKAAAKHDQLGKIFADMLTEAEADRLPLDSAASKLIADLIGFDNSIYDRLVAIRFGHNLPVPQICKTCACSWNDPCLSEGVDTIESPCSWAEADLCTACVPYPEKNHAS